MRCLNGCCRFWRKAEPENSDSSTHGQDRNIRKKWSGYHRRSLVELKVPCFKLLGERVMARDFYRQVVQLQVCVAILNRFTRIGLQYRKLGPSPIHAKNPDRTKLNNQTHCGDPHRQASSIT